MEFRAGKSIKFECELISPFHTTQRAYANLLKCAPFITGSALRGSILKYMIEQNCTEEFIEKLKKLNDSSEISQFHNACKLNCPIKIFFSNPQKPSVVFSFGNFLEIERSYSSVTRIALTRDNRVASKGKLVNAECITPNSNFEFRITLFDDALDIKNMLMKCVEYSGQNMGVGRFKSVGFGRFKVRNVIEQDISDTIHTDPNEIEKKVRIKFLSPLVFPNGIKSFSLEKEDLKSTFSTLLFQRTCEILVDSRNLAPINIQDISARINPEFVHRWSLECSKPENRLVAWRGSEFDFELTPTENADLQLKIASAYGIGDWRDTGYGEFKVGNGNGYGDY